MHTLQGQDKKGTNHNARAKMGDNKKSLFERYYNVLRLIDNSQISEAVLALQDKLIPLKDDADIGNQYMAKKTNLLPETAIALLKEAMKLKPRNWLAVDLCSPEYQKRDRMIGEARLCVKHLMLQGGQNPKNVHAVTKDDFLALQLKLSQTQISQTERFIDVLESIAEKSAGQPQQPAAPAGDQDAKQHKIPGSFVDVSDHKNCDLPADSQSAISGQMHKNRQKFGINYDLRHAARIINVYDLVWAIKRAVLDYIEYVEVEKERYQQIKEEGKEDGWGFMPDIRSLEALQQMALSLEWAYYKPIMVSSEIQLEKIQSQITEKGHNLRLPIQIALTEWKHKFLKDRADSGLPEYSVTYIREQQAKCELEYDLGVDIDREGLQFVYFLANIHALRWLFRINKLNQSAPPPEDQEAKQRDIPGGIVDVSGQNSCDIPVEIRSAISGQIPKNGPEPGKLLFTAADIKAYRDNPYLFEIVEPGHELKTNAIEQFFINEEAIEWLNTDSDDSLCYGTVVALAFDWYHSYCNKKWKEEELKLSAKPGGRSGAWNQWGSPDLEPQGVRVYWKKIDEEGMVVVDEPENMQGWEKVSTEYNNLLRNAAEGMKIAEIIKANVSQTKKILSENDAIQMACGVLKYWNTIMPSLENSGFPCSWPSQRPASLAKKQAHMATSPLTEQQTASPVKRKQKKPKGLTGFYCEKIFQENEEKRKAILSTNSGDSTFYGLALTWQKEYKEKHGSAPASYQSLFSKAKDHCRKELNIVEN